MSQTRTGSLVESLVNVAIGFSINTAANYLVFPLLGWTIDARQNLALGAIYTAISVARSYAIRRWFNGYIRRFAERVSHAGQ